MRVEKNELDLIFSCHNEFPGLVHFVFIDRFRGNICSPSLTVDTILSMNGIDECFLERKVR